MSKNSTAVSIKISDIPITNLTMQDALNAIDAAIVDKVPTKIGFVNADCINIASKNKDYEKTIQKMDWVFADGIGLKLAGIILNSKVSENVNGTDLFPKLCEDLAKNGRSLYLLGAKPGVAQAAASWAVKKYAGLRIAGTQDGYYSQSEESRVIEKIKASQPDVLLVAMGAPKQELWIEKNSQSTQATVTMGVGGLFDFYSGNIKRAPKWMSSMGLEWIFRLMQEPQRMWKRYLIGNWIFMIRIFKIKIKNWKLAK